MNGENQEFYAASVQEAVARAARSLGIAQDEVDYSVLDEGSSGFLGIGARDARITVSAPSALPTPSPDPADEPSSSSVESTDPVADPEPVGELDVAVTTSAAETDETATTAPVEEAPEDLILAVGSFAIQILEKMGFDATVDAYDAGEVVKVDVATREAGLLIGQKGETLDAIQYLANVVVYKNRAFIKRVVVDTEGYRQRRVEALQGMAHRAARRVQRERRAVDLPPMAAAERRVIHVYLKQNPNVLTSSEGQEDDRRVVVSPNY